MSLFFFILESGACEGLCFLKSEAYMHSACVEMLLSRDVPVDAVAPSTGRTCLQELVSNHRCKTSIYESSKIHLYTVEAPCIRGASVTLQDSAGESALSITTEAGLSSLRQLLYTYV